MAKKNKTLNYLGIGAALVVIWYWYKNKSIQGIGAARTKKRYFLKTWFSMDDSNATFEEYPTKKEALKWQKINDKRGYANKGSEYHSKIIEEEASAVDNYMLAKMKVSGMKNSTVVGYYSKIFNYKLIDDTFNDPIWNRIPEIREILINYFAKNDPTL